MRGKVQFSFDAVEDAVTGGSMDLVDSSGEGIGCEDEGEDGENSDNFHDILNIRINLNGSTYHSYPSTVTQKPCFSSFLHQVIPLPLSLKLKLTLVSYSTTPASSTLIL